MIWRTSAH